MADSKIIVLDNKNVTIWCYPNDGIVHHQFHRYCYGDDFRNILTTSREAFEKYHCIKWLSDDRLFGAMLPADKEWGDAFWKPKVIEAGWKYWAMVLPEKVTGKMNIEKLVQEYQHLGIVASFHTEPEAALAWLRRQE